MTIQYQGDPKLYVNETGAYLKFKGGQPVMDQGLENRVAIPLLTRRRSKSDKKPWVGNLVFLNSKHRIGSDFEEAFEAPITLSSLEDRKKAGEKALQSMIDDKLASDIIVTVTNPTGYRIDTNFLIKAPKFSEVGISYNGANWIIQNTDPPEPDPPDPPDPPEPETDGFGAYEFGDQYFGEGY
jgi:phage gp46-like protein